MRLFIYAGNVGSRNDHERDYKHQESRRQYGYEIKTINRRSEEERSRWKRRESLATARGS